ncbi:MAG: hypothetical protein GX221_07615 [Candidatus Riflebacteria bacterium]|nr:hypothetical protein [Candidatus Riflebacteria bacterium]
MIRKKTGSCGGLLIILSVILITLIYFGYTKSYNEARIKIYDREMTRVLELPAYSIRKSPVDKQFFGECIIAPKTAYEPMMSELAANAQKCGFRFTSNPSGAMIDIHENMKINCYKLEGENLLMQWKPDLSPKRMAEAKAALLKDPTLDKLTEPPNYSEE